MKNIRTMIVKIFAFILWFISYQSYSQNKIDPRVLECAVRGAALTYCKINTDANFKKTINIELFNKCYKPIIAAQIEIATKFGYGVVKRIKIKISPNKSVRTSIILSEADIIRLSNNVRTDEIKLTTVVYSDGTTGEIF